MSGTDVVQIVAVDRQGVQRARVDRVSWDWWTCVMPHPDRRVAQQVLAFRAALEAMDWLTEQGWIAVAYTADGACEEAG